MLYTRFTHLRVTFDLIQDEAAHAVSLLPPSTAAFALPRHLHGQFPRSMSLIQLRGYKEIRSIRCSKKGVAPTSSNALTSRPRANGPAATTQGARRTLTERRAPVSTIPHRMDEDDSVKPSFPTKGAKASERSSTQSELNHVGNAQGVVARATTALCAGPWPVTRRSDGLRSPLVRAATSASMPAKFEGHFYHPKASYLLYRGKTPDATGEYVGEFSSVLTAKGMTTESTPGITA